MASEIGVQKLMHTNATQAATINSSGQLIIDDGLQKSEGGAVNTSIAQGLAKAWVHFDGNISTPAIDDSLNMSSLSDLGTGQFKPVLSNNFSASGGYSAAGGASWTSVNGSGAFVSFKGDDYSTDGVGIYVYRSDTYAELAAKDVTISYHGDLA